MIPNRTTRPILALALVLALAPARAQVTRAGFVAQPTPGEKPVLYLQHAFQSGGDATTLRLDGWGERWGIGVGAALLHPGGGAGSGGGVDLALMRSLRRQHVSAEGFGVQAQAGVSAGSRGGEWTWEVPALAGLLWSLPVPASFGHLQTHLWVDAGPRLRGADGVRNVGVGGGAGVRVYGQDGALRGWGAQAHAGLLHIGGETEHGIEVGVSRVLVPFRR
jgi:hypothetical protein